MNHRQPPAAAPGLDLRTAPQVIKQTSSIFLSHLSTFLFLAFLVLTFRSDIENGTRYLTSFIDENPSIRSLFSRLDIPDRKIYSSDDRAATNRHSRRPFLHLTRVGTLSENLLSGDEDDDQFLLGSHPKAQPNGSFVRLSNFNARLGFSSYVADNGINFLEIVRPGLSFKQAEGPLQSKDHDEGLDKVGDSVKSDEDEGGKVVDWEFLIKGLELHQRDALALCFLVCLFSAGYVYVIVGVLVTYSWVLGIVFVVVVNHLLGRYRSWAGTVWDGSKLGLKRLYGFILVRWAVKDAVTQLLGLWFFGEIKDQYSFFRIFVRLKLMPFSIMSPWVRGFEEETAGFLFVWLLLDMVVEFVFAVDSWVVIVDSRRSGREIVKEGCYLLSTMFKQAVIVKCLESMLCGSFMRLTLARHFGNIVATSFQSVLEVYFMVAWLIFYFAMRYKDASSLGRTFGQRELEGFLQGLR